MRRSNVSQCVTLSLFKHDLYFLCYVYASIYVLNKTHTSIYEEGKEGGDTLGHIRDTLNGADLALSREATS